MGYSPWGHEELDVAKQQHTHARMDMYTHTHIYTRWVVDRYVFQFLFFR